MIKNTDSIGNTFFNQRAPVVLKSRVRWDGSGTYTSTSLVADTGLNSTLAGLSVTELQYLLNGGDQFAQIDKRQIYRSAPRNSTGAYSIPLFKAVFPCNVLCIGVTTTSLAGSTGNLSVGTSGNNQSILGTRAANTFNVNAGSATDLWAPAYPYSAAAPFASASGDCVYFDPTRSVGQRLLAQGTTVNLYLPTDTISSGDITFEVLASTPIMDTYGDSSIGRVTRDPSSALHTQFDGAIKYPIIPAF